MTTDTKTVQDLQNFLDSQDRKTPVVVIDKADEFKFYNVVGLYTGNGQVRIIVDSTSTSVLQSSATTAEGTAEGEEECDEEGLTA